MIPLTPQVDSSRKWLSALLYVVIYIYRVLLMTDSFRPQDLGLHGQDSLSSPSYSLTDTTPFKNRAREFGSTRLEGHASQC